MRALLACAGLAAAVFTAQAQTVTTGLQLSHDSDGLDQQQLTVGATASSGWGLKTGALRYRAVGGWTAHGETLAATYLLASETTHLDASAGASRIGKHMHAVGTLDWWHSLGAASSMGLSAERNLVDSQPGIEAGLVYDSLALVADHAFSDRYDVGLAGGSTWFSDGNHRPFLRTRWNAGLEANIGLNAYVKTRSYWNSSAHRPEYFSPERLNEVSLGLSSRFVVAGGVVVSAAVDAGRQYTEAGTEPIWSGSIGVSSTRGASPSCALTLQTANTAGLLSGSPTYRYTSLSGRLSVPF